MKKRKKLVIISHTEHYYDNGIIKGWGATINEINYLADYWDEVVHIACLHTNTAPASSLPYTKSNVKFVSIPPYGGKSLTDKLLIFIKIPLIIFRVIENIKNASEVQLRVPTSMALFLLPLFAYLIPRKFKLWVKYAGNWNQENPPISYRLQRWLLKKNVARCKVTINGMWENQPNHCISFENPCLTKEQLSNGKTQTQIREFKEPYKLIFIGRVESEKGIGRIIDAVRQFDISVIEEVVIIGDGPSRNDYTNSIELPKSIQFVGSKNTYEIHEYLKNADFLVLPSTASEGFPKVIAEAACYGVIPIVSDVGSISHYINKKNGFIWPIKEDEDFYTILKKATVETSSDQLKQMSKNVHEVSTIFTFECYYKKLEDNIL